MKIRNPKNRSDLLIKRSDRVLEIGSGNNPHPRSNVIVDKYTDNNTHRSGDLKVLNHQLFIQADGENLPFKDHEFDYVICCHVLEHVEDPVKFLSEQFRVARRGFVETPSLIGEYLVPKSSHKWILHEFKNTLCMINKSTINFNCTYDLGELIQLYLPTHSIGFKILERTHPNISTLRIEWESNFNYVVNPSDPDVLKYFKGQWKLEWAKDFFPQKNLWQEFIDTSVAMADIILSVIKSKILKLNDSDAK